jgi:hypothetical protein
MIMKFRESQAAALVAAKRAHDQGQLTDDELLDLTRESTGHEINAAMDDYGQGTEPWSRVSRPSRP